MAWIKIPENKTEMQIGGNWVKIPSGMKEVEIPDNLLGAQPATNSAPTYAPSAPDMSKAVDATPKGKTWYDKVGEFADQISPINVIKGVGKELGGMLEYSHYDGATGKELEAKKATEALARAKHAGDDRNIISQLVGDESKDQAVKERTENLLYNWAKKNNYDDVREANGKYYLQKGDKFIPVDEPGIGDSLSTYLNEMGVPMGAISVASALLPTKKLSTAQKAISTALATAGASGAGAAMDLMADKRILGDETINGDDYLKHALRGASDDALISGPLATMASPAVKEALKKGVSKASDYSIVKPVARYVINDNIGGAEKAIMDKLGGEANAAAAQNLSKEALDEDMYKALLNDDKTYTLPNVGNEKVQKGINYVNEKILAPAQKTTRDIIKGEGTREREMDLFLTALGNDAKGADIIADAVARDPKSFSKIYKMSSDLNADAKNTLLNMVDKKKTADILSGYEKRTKDNFGEVINALDDAFAGKEASANLLQAKHELGTQALRLPAGYRDSTLELLGNTKGFKGLNEVRNVLSADMARLTAPDAITAGTKKTLGKMIEAVDNAIDNVAEQAFNNPALSQKAKDVLKQARSEYALFKELQNSKIYHDVMGELKSSGDITNSLLKALSAENGLDFKALTSRLSSSEQEALETNLIRGVIEKFSKDGITDFSKVSAALKDAPFESKRAVEIMSELNKKAPILNNTSALLEKLTAINPKAKELQQGIGHSVTGALMTMKRNLAIERLKSLLPVLGNDVALKNHIRNAINNAGDLKSVINNLEKVEVKDAPQNSQKLLEAFKNEVKALREEAQTGEIKGDSFITKQSPAPKSDLNVKISVDDWVRELGGINANKQIKADLTNLYEKHKELFAKPSDVFMLIKAVKENPTFFYNNNEPNTALIGKILDNGKLGKIGIQKEYDSEYLKLNHATYSSKADKENKRLLRRNEKSHLVGSPTPTQLTLGEATEPTADGAKALLDENSKDAGIIQTFIQPGSKSNSELGLPNEIIPKQTQELDKTFKNQKDKNTKTINASPHIASGLLGGIANGADENGNVSPEEFAKGFIYALFGSKFSASAVKRISPELYNSILGLGKKMPQMAKDNPKLLTKIYGSAKSNSINSFAGEKALNASANKLSKAKSMLEKGEDEVKIWQSTGWYKDKDGAWKFEIDDNPAKIKNQNADKLGDLLEHKELFKAYPELKDIKIKKIIDEKGENLGYYDPNKKEIGINNIGDKSTLMHEVQHAIQDIEGFAKGLGAKGENYRLSHGEAEARNVETRLNLGDKFRVKIVKDNNQVGDDYHTWIRDESDIKTFKQTYNDDGGGDLTPDFTEAMAKKAIDSGEITVYSSRPIKAGNFVTPSKMEAKSYAGSGKIYEEKLNLNDVSWIDALQGQVTRNKDIHPHETFDVNPNETFVSREDGVNFRQKLPELKEKRGIYNVTYNGKFSTPVYKDVENVEGAVRYAIGNKNKGAKHIEIKHLEDTTKEGYVTKQELLNMGENMRKFIKEYKEPFINDRKARLYEWEDKDGVRFRLVINDIKDKNGGSGIHSAITSTSANDDIITFYSDRNLKEPMKFENPKLKLLDAIDNSSDKVSAVEKILLNKNISDGVKAKAVNRLTKNKISQGVKTNYISTKNSNNN
ncbi:MAG: LPD23 domain-containing protein [Campylobacter concisus]|nr:LPD23 domain-containing protein [Campylobacter concisus]